MGQFAKALYVCRAEPFERLQSGIAFNGPYLPSSAFFSPIWVKSRLFQERALEGHLWALQRHTYPCLLSCLPAVGIFGGDFGFLPRFRTKWELSEEQKDKLREQLARGRKKQDILP